MENTQEKDIFELIEKWGEERGFYDPENGTTVSKQMLKLMEETGELAADIARGRCVKDSIGDIAVVLVGVARLSGVNFRQCAQTAYDEIRHRRGKMVNGIFIKEADF